MDHVSHHSHQNLSSFDLLPCSKNVSLSLNSIEDHMIHSKTTKVCRAKQEHVSVLCFWQSRSDYQKSLCYSLIEEIISIRHKSPWWTTKWRHILWGSEAIRIACCKWWMLVGYCEWWMVDSSVLNWQSSSFIFQCMHFHHLYFCHFMFVTSTLGITLLKW